MNIITCSGYGSSGSSAATNFIEEFSTVHSLDSSFECHILHSPDGIHDLITALKEGHQLKTDVAIHRFLNFIDTIKNQYSNIFGNSFELITKEYIESLITCKWNGKWDFEGSFIKSKKVDSIKFNIARSYYNKQQQKDYPLHEGTYGWRPRYYSFGEQYIANPLLEYETITKRYLEKLFSHVNSNNFLLIDQLIPSFSTESYLGYFDNIKTIIVDRDPRDLYLANKLFYGDRWIPSSNINNFIKWYYDTRILRKQYRSKDILFVQFENLVYNYETAAKSIIKFVGLDEKDHIQKFKRFNPEVSEINTRLWESYKHCNDDIKQIEDKLGQFCYTKKDVTKTQLNFTDSFIPIEDIRNKADEIYIKPLVFKDKIRYIFKLMFNILFRENNLFRLLRKFRRTKQKISMFLINVIKILSFILIYPLEVIYRTFIYIRSYYDS